VAGVLGSRQITVIGALCDRPNPTRSATPAFFMDRPPSFGFEKPDTASPGIRMRHHTRLWPTPACLTPDCRPIWAARASFDIGIEISQSLYLPTHRIDSIIDNERTLIASYLVKFGAMLDGTIRVTTPRDGKNAACDPFWTDGRAVLLLMPSYRPVSL
jgi:hypothetical protein